MFSIRDSMRQMGYLFVDHRASPGLTPEQARMNGYDPRLTAEGQLYEADTMTCAHCKAVVVKNLARTRERAHCRPCNHYICDACAYEAAQPDYIHKPHIAKVIEALEQSPIDVVPPLTLGSSK